MAMKVTLLVRKKPWQNVSSSSVAVHLAAPPSGRKAEPGQQRQRRGVGAQHARPEADADEAGGDGRAFLGRREAAFGPAQDDSGGAPSRVGAARRSPRGAAPTPG